MVRIERIAYAEASGAHRVKRIRVALPQTSVAEFFSVQPRCLGGYTEKTRKLHFEAKPIRVECSGSTSKTLQRLLVDFPGQSRGCVPRKLRSSFLPGS